MTLWEEAAAAYPGLMAQLTEVGLGVSVFREAFEADEVHGPFYRELIQEDPRATGGLFGHGLWFGAGDLPVPAVFVQPGLAPFHGAPIQQTPLASRRLVGRTFTWPDTTYAVGLPTPQCLIAARRLPQLTPTAQPAGRIAPARGRDVVVNGDQRSWVRALIPEFALTPHLGRWGEVAMTAEAISAPGDAGTLVQRDDGPVVGQILAGQAGFYSLFQDIEYALRAAGIALR
ncbi:hypothetical protein [Kribbella deserti]|uniref:Uncharacterized protein n=1 Tax=Kribbella deserti TaxID=1926257 RepID=A0ABV6QPS7_9ACTN